MIVGFLGLGVLFAAYLVQGQAVQPTPESKAIAFLVREVPRWSRENHCFSCHNNGDAARALYMARRAGWQLPAEVLAETNQWLSEPKRWDHNGGDGAASDKRLARLVFTASAATSWEAGPIQNLASGVAVSPRARAATGSEPSPPQNSHAPRLAAARLAEDQSASGYWPLEGEDSVSSPATYGRLLATFMARDALAKIDLQRFQAAIARADEWLLKQKIVTVTDAAVSVLVSASATARRALDRRDRAMTLLRQSQGKDGGWGDRSLSPSEPFDTALVLLALAVCPPTDEVKGMIARGRAFLIAEQLADGSWVETTRPPGNVSYAQRISTCGWATMALLATQAEKASVVGRTDLKRQGH